MVKGLEIIAFSNGDSNLCSTWSNVPFFLLQALEKKGVTVHRVNIRLQDQSKILTFIIKSVNFLITKAGAIGAKNRKVFISVERFALYDYWVKKKMKVAALKYSESDVLFTFDFRHSGADVSNKKSMLFSDWTIQYAIESHQKREPTFFERRSILRQEKTINSADAVVTLFPNVYDELRKKYDNKVHYLGNVINCDAAKMENLEKIHFESNQVLFIGRKKYKSGAISLINAMRTFNATMNTSLKLNIIGMTQHDLKETDEFITYYGYLDKSNEHQKNQYYDLLANAKFVCNTTENWMGASSIIESMYWMCPVIINPTEDIFKTFGEDIDFGIYCKSNNSSDVFNSICKIVQLSEDEYFRCSRAAAEAVKDYTWDAYADRLITLMQAQ